MRALPTMLAVAAVACGGGDGGGVTHTFKDQGRICLAPDGVDPGSPFVRHTDPVSFAADRPATITVMAPACLSGSCSHDAQATCTVVLDGATLDVTSAASFRQQGQVCTTDCGALVAKCATPPLPAGTYQVRHGGETLTLTIPSTTVPPCAGVAP